MVITDSEINETIKAYPELKYKYNGQKMIVFGRIYVDQIYNGFHVCEYFDIEIELPEGYPYELPIVKETGNKVDKKYPHRYSDGQLCLETDLKILFDSEGIINLKSFISTYVMNYFFSYKYFERYKQFPFGERTHGTLGILESYMDCFNLKTIHEAYKFVSIITSPKYIYRGHLPCPCGSGIRIRNCHGKQIRLVINSSILEVQLKNDMNLINKEIALHEQYRRKTK